MIFGRIKLPVRMDKIKEIKNIVDYDGAQSNYEKKTK